MRPQVTAMAEAKVLEGPQACRLRELGLFQSIKPTLSHLCQGNGGSSLPPLPPLPPHPLLPQLAASPHAATLTALDLRATPLALDAADLGALGRFRALQRLELEGSLHATANPDSLEHLEALLPAMCKLMRLRMHRRPLR